jgi:hypothetical protein
MTNTEIMTKQFQPCKLNTDRPTDSDRYLLVGSAGRLKDTSTDDPAGIRPTGLTQQTNACGASVRPVDGRGVWDRAEMAGHGGD